MDVAWSGTGAANLCMGELMSLSTDQPKGPAVTPAARRWSMEDGTAIDAVYAPGSVPPQIGEPGRFPFTRHIYAAGNRGRPWAPSIYSGFGTAEDANQRFRYLLERGNGRANVATDLPTQIGMDSDDPDAAGEVGRVGVAIDSLRDFEVMFQGVPLDTTPVSFNINTPAPIFVAMLVAVAKQQGAPAAALTGTVANDLLHEYLARGTWRYPPDAALRLTADLVEYCTREMPKFYPFNIRSILLHECGAHPGQEIGLTFAIACRYIDEVLRRGITIDAFAPRISFFFGMGLQFLQEASKFRAARRMWAQIIRDQYGSTSENSQRLRITSVAPCGSHFTAADAELNLVRGTLGVVAGALGGVQAMLGTTIDEAFDIPTEHTARLALRTQQIVALESDICATVDPLGGSWFIEAMTDAIEASARQEIAKVEGSSGIVEAILAGRPQSDLAARAYEIARELESGSRKKVGVNIHRPSAGPPQIELHEPDHQLHERRAAELARLRSGRDAARVDQSLAAVRDAATSGTNVMQSLIEAVEAYATVGEISRVFDGVFGGYTQPVVI
jgi:methylmalonyl-CoA mutase, N-terminal domain